MKEENKKQQPPVDKKTRKVLGSQYHESGLIYIGDGMYIDSDGYFTENDW